MITVSLSNELGATVIFHEALSLELDRERLQSYLNGVLGVSQERADAWLSDLAAGKVERMPALMV